MKIENCKSMVNKHVKKQQQKTSTKLFMVHLVFLD